MHAEETARHPNLYDFLLLGAVCAVGAFLRLWNLGGESLRLDEAQSIWQASHSLDFIRQYMIKNVHLPLHNSLLHLWMRFFGSSETAVRSLAAIPGIVALPALWLLAREFVSRKWALFAVLVGAISPFAVWYSRENRMYSLLFLLAVFSHYFFIKILRENKIRGYILYALVGVIGIYTHYFFILALLSQAMFFGAGRIAAIFKKEAAQEHAARRSIFFRLTAVAVFLLAAYAPWLYSLMEGYGSGSLAPILEEPSSFNMVLSLFEFLFGHQPERVASFLIALWPLAILIGFAYLQRREPEKPGMWFLVIGTFLPVVLAYAASILWQPLYLTRYLTVSSPLLYVLVAYILSGLPWRQMLAAITVLALFFALLVQQFHPSSPAKENHRALAESLAAETDSRDIVVLAPPYLIYPFQYYWKGAARVTTMPIWDKRKGAIPLATPARLGQDAEIIKGSHRRIFLVVAQDLAGAVLAKEHFDRSLTKLSKEQFSKNLWVHVYKAEYEEATSTEPLPREEENNKVTEKKSALPPQSQEYIVKKGDTLSKIAERIYGSIWRFTDIAKQNKIPDPDFIFPGQRLALPPLSPR